MILRHRTEYSNVQTSTFPRTASSCAGLTGVETGGQAFVSHRDEILRGGGHWPDQARGTLSDLGELLNSDQI